MGPEINMLIHLSVRHLAVVDDITLSFEQGMTSLTGETGAGKSILVDALGLVLGDRADSNMVRHGCDRAEIEASFDITNNIALQQWLIEQELDEQKQCHLRRTVSSEGPSRGYINGRVVPLSQLRIISENSIDIHGQHAHQSLIRSDTQRLLLDTVAKTKPFLAKLAVAHHQWQTLKRTVAEQELQSEQHIAQLELLQYQINELEPLDLSESNVRELINSQKKLAHASELMTTAQTSLHLLYDQEEGAAYSHITQALSNIEALANIEPRFANIVEVLNSTALQLDEAASELRQYLDSGELDTDLLSEVENQLSALHAIARKHHIEVEALPAHYNLLCDQLSQLTNRDEHHTQLQKQLVQQESICLELCQKIGHMRQQAAGPLAQEISATIQQLAMPGGRVEFVIMPMANGSFNDTGADHVQLLVTTNPGQVPGDLGKVASGGELARISLAIQVVTAGTRSVPTLVFDEVDVGIGGSIAEIVGQHLRQLASTQQVICITHLPQVAAQAHRQVQVSKKQLKNTTHIELLELSQPQRIEEIARMLGGVTITQKTLSHAKEMLEQTPPKL
jgi:DNA repair protein RecN (Recombination protein N)